VRKIGQKQTQKGHFMAKICPTKLVIKKGRFVVIQTFLANY